jgi:hypothetical protein
MTNALVLLLCVLLKLFLLISPTLYKINYFWAEEHIWTRNLVCPVQLANRFCSRQKARKFREHIWTATSSLRPASNNNTSYRGRGWRWLLGRTAAGEAEVGSREHGDLIELADIEHALMVVGSPERSHQPGGGVASMGKVEHGLLATGGRSSGVR